MNSTANDPTVQISRYALPSIPSLFGQALWFYRKHFALIFGISAIPFILDTIQLFAGNYILTTVLIILTSLISFIFQLVLLAAVAEDGQTVWGAYKKGLSLFIPSLWIFVLKGLALFSGTLLFFIPGLLLSIWLILSYYTLVAEGRRGFSALARSWYYVKGYWLPVFWRLLVFYIIIFVAAFVILFIFIIFIIFGFNIFTVIRSEIELLEALSKVDFLIRFFGKVLSNFLVIPLGVIYFYVVYSSLRQIKETMPSEAEEQKLRRYITVFAAIGFIVLISLIALMGFLLNSEASFLPLSR